MSKSMVIEGGYPGVSTTVHIHTEHLLSNGRALITFYMAGSSMTIQVSRYELAQLADMLNTAREEVTA